MTFVFILSNLLVNPSIPCLRRRTMKLSSNKWLQKKFYIWDVGVRRLILSLQYLSTTFSTRLVLRNDCRYCLCMKFIFLSCLAQITLKQIIHLYRIIWYVFSIRYFMLRVWGKRIWNASNTPHKCTDCGFIIIYLDLIKQERKQENKASKVCVKQQTINLHICDSTELDIQTTFTIIWIDRCLSYIK